MRQGQSSMIATVILLLAAVVAGIMVTSFGSKTTNQATDTIDNLGDSIQCGDIRLSLKVESDNLIMRNRGTLGIDEVVIRKYLSGSVKSDTVTSFDGNEKLFPGVDDEGLPVEFEYDLSNLDGENYDRIEVVPLVRDGVKLVGCNEVSL
jgi:hypothetical protein